MSSTSPQDGLFRNVKAQLSSLIIGSKQALAASRPQSKSSSSIALDDSRKEIVAKLNQKHKNHLILQPWNEAALEVAI